MRDYYIIRDMKFTGRLSKLRQRLEGLCRTVWDSCGFFLSVYPIDCTAVDSQIFTKTSTVTSGFHTRDGAV